MGNPEDSELQPTIPVQQVDDSAPPDGGYGWVVAFAMWLVNGGTWGILTSYGVFLSYYISTSRFPGTSDLDYTFIGGINFAAAMLVAPFVNIATKHYGTKPVMYCGCVCWFGGFIGASFATGAFWQVFLSQGLLVGIATGLVWLPAAPITAQWFSSKRSLAQGIGSSGSGVIGVIFSVATTPMIDNLSLGWALRIIGICSGGMLLLATILIKDRNTTIKPEIHPFDTRLLSRKGIILLIGYTFFTVLGYIVMIYSLSPFALSLGLSQYQAGNVTAFVNVGTAIGRPFVGVLSDKFGRITVACSITFFNFIICFAWWIPITTYAALIPFSIVVGATAGIYWATIAPLVGEVVDLKLLPSALGLMWLVVALPSLFSEAIALEIRKPAGESYQFLYTQIYSGLVFLISAGFLFELRRLKWGLKAREKHR